MISIDFSFAVALFIFCGLLAGVGFWFSSQRGKDKDLSLDEKFIWHCAVCTYTYINTKDESFSLCPRCASYNKK